MTNTLQFKKIVQIQTPLQQNKTNDDSLPFKRNSSATWKHHKYVLLRCVMDAAEMKHLEIYYQAKR
jgi:hypothetical protein